MMTAEDFFNLFDVKENLVEKFLSEIEYPELDSITEEEIHKVLLKVRKNRNKLIKFQLELRKFKVRFTCLQEQNDLYKSQVIQELYLDQNFSKLKTKEERDLIINNKLQAKSGYIKELNSYNLRLVTLLSNIVLAVNEYEKIFNEFELIYNLGKLNSYGYLISQANSKLNSIV